MKLFTFRVFSIMIATLATSSVLHATPILVNGSLTGPIANGVVPPGWTTLSESPDTMDQNNNVGVVGKTEFVTAPAGPSPDGGTWVGFAHNGSFVETFGQSISGFTVGAGYTVSWYLGNFGYSGVSPPYGEPNGVEVLLDGVSVGSSSLVSSGSGWTPQSLNFLATSAIQQLAFRPVSTAKSYISIDGLALANATPNPVPEPSTLLLLASGLAGIFGYGWRRKRAA